VTISGDTVTVVDLRDEAFLSLAEGDGTNLLTDVEDIIFSEPTATRISVEEAANL